MTTVISNPRWETTLSRYTHVMTSTIRFILITALVFLALAPLRAVFQAPFSVESFAATLISFSIVVGALVAFATVLDPLLAPSGRWFMGIESWIDSCSMEIKE